jgi:hypothetical protein
MKRFLLEVRIYPDEGTDGAPGRLEVTGEELISVLANSTASEALATALDATIEWEVLTIIAADLADAANSPRKVVAGDGGTVTVHLEGGCLRDVEGLPDGWSYQVHDVDEDDHDEATCPHCGRSDDPYGVASIVFPPERPTR